MKLDPHRTGLTLGTLLGLWHLAWSTLVGTGLAQPILDWITSLHMLNNPFRVEPFDLGTAVMLIIITSLIGYLAGWVVAFLWNAIHKKQ